MRIYDIQSAFARGELSPRLHGRTDIDHYAMGLKECTNWYVLRQGALRKRPGTEFIAEVKTSSRKTRLIPFTFSTQQSYMLEFGDAYFRVYANGGRVEVAGVPVEVVTPYLEAELFELKYAQSADTLYIAHPKHAPRKISRLSDTQWSVEALEFKDGPYLKEPEDVDTTLTLSATGGIIPAMTSNTVPSGMADASSQSNPAFHAFDKNENTAHTLVGTTGWLEYDPPAPDGVVVGYVLQAGTAGLENMLSTWAFQGYDGASWVTLDSRRKESGWAPREVRYYEFKNSTAYQSYRIKWTATDGGGVSHCGEMEFKESPDTMAPVTLVAGGTAGINDGSGFLASDVGRAIRLFGADGAWRWFKITARTSATEVSGKLYGQPLPDLEPVKTWKMGAWCDACGYPSSVTFFEERLVWARTDTEPQKVWGSKSFGFDDHGVSSPLADDDAFSIEIASNQVNEIKWISEASELLIGTSAAIRTLGPSDTSKAFSATNARQQRHTTIGSAALQPARIGSVSLYADAYAKSLRELFFSFENNAFDAPELTILSEHLLSSGITDLAYAASPDSILWIAVGSGDLISLTFERDQRIVGMARHVVTGGAADIQGAVESIATIPGSDASEIWLVVRRTIGATTKRHVERLSGTDPANETVAGSYLDSSLKYAGAPVTTVTGLGHLEGEIVGVVADGVVVSDQLVAGGQIMLSGGASASLIVAGLRFTSSLAQLRPAISGQDGSHLGRLKAIAEVIVDVQDSLALKAGRAGSEVDFLERTAGEPLDQAIALRTGSFKLHFVGGWRNDDQVSLVSDQPLPATIRSITRALEMEP